MPSPFISPEQPIAFPMLMVTPVVITKPCDGAVLNWFK
jgi:hypothetical protein